MKRFLLCVLLGLVPAASPDLGLDAQQDARPDAQEVTIGERFSLYSEILGEERAYWVYVPASYDQQRYAPQRYPVLYLLDGNAHFHSASGVVEFMSTGINGNIQTPEMIVVAIPNTDRTRDLTPTETALGFDGSEGAARGGGGDAFLGFIAEELFAEIDATYRTRPYRIFVGHSLGGLIALHALMDAPEMFRSYIAIDPSLWWDDQLLVRRAETYFSENRDLRGAVYISSANNPALEPGAPMVMRETAEAFTRAMDRAASPDFRPALQTFDDEDHGSVPLLSLYHGLLHVFDGYKPSVAAIFEDPAVLGPHFKKVSERLGAEFLPPESLVNQLGYAMLGRQEVAKAITLFELNVEHYPGSSNVHDSLGEAYAANDETELAIRHYERSLELNPDNENARERLEALKRTGGRE